MPDLRSGGIALNLTRALCIPLRIADNPLKYCLAQLVRPFLAVHVRTDGWRSRERCRIPQSCPWVGLTHGLGWVESRRLYILCWSEFSRRRLLPAVSPAAGHLTTPTVAGLPGLCENFRPTTSKSSPILRLLSSHWATSVVRTRVVGVANFGDSLRRLSSLQHRIYNLLVSPAGTALSSKPAARRGCCRMTGQTVDLE